MRIAVVVAIVLGLATALAGIAVAIIAFEPIPFADSMDFYDAVIRLGGWHGFGFQELYARHNEHRLVVPRLWFLVDLVAFGASQWFLITVSIVSAACHAVLLTALFGRLGNRGPMLWMFAALALGAVLSPAQWENLVWGFQVQFIQVWLFATLALMAVPGPETRHPWWRSGLAVLCGLASTYSMANGIVVWPLLVMLALWRGRRGGPLWVIVAFAVAVIVVEALGYEPHPGHGDPAQTFHHPVEILRYVFRYLTNAMGAIGTTGQEILGAVLLLGVLATAVDALLRRGRYRPVHGVLLTVAGFVIGAGILTALGRVNFGVGQANATRYATPSFVFLLVATALLLDRLSRLDRPRVRMASAVGAVVLILVPGMVDASLHLPVILGDRDARVDAVVTYLAGGYRPPALKALYPALPRRPFRVLQWFDERDAGPFTDRARFMPTPALLAETMAKPSVECRGHVDFAADEPVIGIVINGWAAAPGSAEQPRWVLAVDASGKVVAWGASLVRRDDVGRSLGIGWKGRGFSITRSEPVAGPLSVVGAFDDGRTCLVASEVNPRTPRFLAALPEGARPAADNGWTVVEGVGADRVGAEPPPVEVVPAVGTLGQGSHLLARMDLPATGDRAVLAIPVRTGQFPMWVQVRVIDLETGALVGRLNFARPSDRGWVWRTVPGTADPRFQGHRLRIEAAAAGPAAWQGLAVGRPHWLPSEPHG